MLWEGDGGHGRWFLCVLSLGVVSSFWRERNRIDSQCSKRSGKEKSAAFFQVRRETTTMTAEKVFLGPRTATSHFDSMTTTTPMPKRRSPVMRQLSPVITNVLLLLILLGGFCWTTITTTQAKLPALRRRRHGGAVHDHARGAAADVDGIALFRFKNHGYYHTKKDRRHSSTISTQATVTTTSSILESSIFLHRGGSAQNGSNNNNNNNSHINNNGNAEQAKRDNENYCATETRKQSLLSAT